MTVKKETGVPFKGGINPVDLYVGGRVRLRRKYLNMSQHGLAGSLDLTFQQVQKYERGANRISASKLWEISKKLKVPIAYFFEGLEEGLPCDHDDGSLFEPRVQAFLMTADGVELAKSYHNIKKPQLKRKVLDLVRALSEGDEA